MIFILNDFYNYTYIQVTIITEAVGFRFRSIQFEIDFYPAICF